VVVFLAIADAAGSLAISRRLSLAAQTQPPPTIPIVSGPPLSLHATAFAIPTTEGAEPRISANQVGEHTYSLKIGCFMDAVPVHGRAKAHSYSLGLFVVAFGVLPINDALARRAIPTTYLTYPVFIALKTADTSRNGCGFYINAGRAMYLVTTRHVLTDGLLPADSISGKLPNAELQLSSYSKDLPLRKRIVVVANLPPLQENSDVRLHHSQDLAGASASGKAPEPGVTMKVSSESDLLGVPTGRA
jgi:hypothetical protein